MSLLNSLHKLLGNVGANVVANTNRTAAQINPFDHGATFNNPQGAGNTGTNPLPPNVRPSTPYNPNAIGTNYVIPGVNPGQTVPYVTHPNSAVQYGHIGGRPVQWQTENLDNLQALPLTQPNFPKYDHLRML